MASITELKYVVAVARERHFGRAAECCFVSQPTLSVGVKRLEESLGVQIFERASRATLKVTDQGRAVIEQAERVLEEVDRLHEIAKQRQDPFGEPLKVGFIHTVGPYLLPPLISEIHEKAPRMPLQITEGLTADLVEQLKTGQLDAVVLSLPFSAPLIRVEPVYHEPFLVATPADHPLATQKEIAPGQLAEHAPLLLGEGHCFRDQVLGVCPDCVRSERQSRLQRTLEGGSLETMRMMVASGAGVTVLPCASAAHNANSAADLVRYVPFAEPVPGRDVAVACRARFPRQEAVALLAEAIRNSVPTCLRPLS